MNSLTLHVPADVLLPIDDLAALRLIDRKELARLLGIAPKTVTHRKALGTIPEPIHQPGSHPRWPLEEIRQWLAARDHRGRLLNADEWNARKPKRK